MSQKPSSASETEEKIRRLQGLRLRQHRLNPPRPIRDARAAVAFIRERRMVMSTGRSSLPVLAEAIAGRQLAGSWMANPEVYRIYKILRKVYKSPDIFAVPLVLGKETLLDAVLGQAVERIASDPQRRRKAVEQLPPLACRLLAVVEADGEVRMDRWDAPTDRARAARRLLERELLVVSTDLHTERGYHTSIVLPWSRSKVPERFVRPARRITHDQAQDELILAAIRSAVIAPEREVRRWFVFVTERLDALIKQGKIEWLASGRMTWLTCPQ